MGIFISTNNTEWNNILRYTKHDFYQLPEYIELESKWNKSYPIGYYTEINNKKVIIPLLIRDININNRILNDKDAISPYGYPGIISNENIDGKELDNILEEFIIDSDRINLVSTFIRLHPILNPLECLKSNLYEIAIIGNTVSIEMKYAIDSIIKNIRIDHKQDIKKLMKLGYYVEYNDWDKLDEFTNIYINNMSRVNAQSNYMYDLQYFAELKKCLGNNIVLCIIKDKNNEIACAGIFTIYSGIQQFHLSGTSEKHLKLSPAKLMIYEMVKYASERNVKVFHLGGGLGARKDGLYKFKSGFSNTEYEFKVIKIINNKVKYDDISNKISNNEITNINYFPKYRTK